MIIMKSSGSHGLVLEYMRVFQESNILKSISTKSCGVDMAKFALIIVFLTVVGAVYVGQAVNDIIVKPFVTTLQVQK